MSASATEICIESEVIKLLSGYFLKAQRKISSHSRLVEDLNVDSVDVVEIIMIVEVAFNVELSPGRVEKWRSVEDIIKLIMEVKGF